MTMPQPGIFAQGNPENTYLELDLDRPEALEEALRALLRIPAAYTEGGTNMVVGVRPGLWRATRPADTPEDAADWDDPIRGTDGFAMPATPHDLWVWLSAGERSILFDRATELRDALAGIATVATELDGWHYKQSRDLTGFIDGSENPSLIEAPAVACVAPGRPGAGASILVFQQWRHEKSWLSLSEHDQELVIGRTKPDSVELPDDIKPVSSHVARTVVDVDGNELDIFRHNVSYGCTGDHGTLFVGFSQDQWRQFEMLRRMAGVDGTRDALTRFTTPLSGATYVIPSVHALADYLPQDDD